MINDLSCVLREIHIKLLGHVCRMDDPQKLKKPLLGKLMKSRPFHGTKQCRRDVVNADLKILIISLNSSYNI